MTDALLILIGAVLVNNFVLVQFLGLCPFLGVSSRLETAAAMSMATAFVLTLASVASYLLWHLLLVPLGLEYLDVIGFILLIALLVQLTELAMRRSSPLLHRSLGVFLPLITSNCAVLGVALLNVDAASNLLDAALLGLGAALGFSLVLTLFAALRERIDAADVPEPFRGPAIAMITAGLMSLAFMGFSGLGVR